MTEIPITVASVPLLASLNWRPTRRLSEQPPPCSGGVAGSGWRLSLISFVGRCAPLPHYDCVAAVESFGGSGTASVAFTPFRRLIAIDDDFLGTAKRTWF